MYEFSLWDLNLPKNIGPVSCVDFLDDKKGFTVKLTDSMGADAKYAVNFGWVYSYKVSNESFRLRLLDELHKDNLYKNHQFFFVENSEWISWLHTETQRVYEGHNIKHYLIITSEDVIDVLSEHEPTVIKLNIAGARAN
jgi:hypothetical protein